MFLLYGFIFFILVLNTVHIYWIKHYQWKEFSSQNQDNLSRRKKNNSLKNLSDFEIFYYQSQKNIARMIHVFWPLKMLVLRDQGEKVSKVLSDVNIDENEFFVSRHSIKTVFLFISVNWLTENFEGLYQTLTYGRFWLFLVCSHILLKCNLNYVNIVKY